MYFPFSPVVLDDIKREAAEAWRRGDGKVWSLYFKVCNARAAESVRLRKIAGTFRPIR